MPKTQFGDAAEMNLTQRLKVVAKLHSYGFSASKIAQELNYSTIAARKDISAVVDRHREFQNLDEYIKDVTARTGEQLDSLQSQKAIIWKQLDWASEWVEQRVVLPDGSSIPEIDGTGEKIFGPRKPSMVQGLTAQLQSLDRQIAELLGLMSKNVDITVTLQKTEQTQIAVLDVIREASPELYAVLLRRLQAIHTMAKTNKTQLMSGRDNRSIDDIVQSDYQEVEYAEAT